MISKEQFKQLVLAGASTVQLAMSIKKMADIVNDEDNIEFPDDVYEIANETHFVEPLTHLVACIAEIIDTDKHDADAVNVMYCNTVSLFAFDNKEADHYLDLVYTFLYEPKSVVEELTQFEKTLPKDEFLYVRRYLI